MAMEAIVAVEEAEAAAERRKADALRESKLLVKKAELDGVAAVEEAQRKALEELKKLATEAEAAARSDSGALTRDTEQGLSALRTQAEARLDEAANLIVERIVKAK